MRALIEIKMDNEAFDNPAELPRILRELATRLDYDNTHQGGTCKIGLFDINGNSVGTFRTGPYKR